MSQKRRDSKNRILRNGESQRQDGRYVYSYVDIDKKRKTVYSWRLEPTDKLPAGRKDDLSLREKEKAIKRNIDDGIINDDNIRVGQLLDIFIDLNNGKRPQTQELYCYYVQVIKKTGIGEIKAKSIKKSYAKKWVHSLQNEYGYGYATIDEAKQVMKKAFEIAIDDRILQTNPFNFPVKTEIVDDRKITNPLTENQRDNLLRFIAEHPHYSEYYDAFYVLFYTGLRISEFAGLTLDNIDFDNNVMYVRQQLRRINGEWMLTGLKTESSDRHIPLSEEVKAALQRIIERHSGGITKHQINGLIQKTKGGLPIAAKRWYDYCKRIETAYNEQYSDDPIILTPHVCRHTFCTLLAVKGINPKALQYLMGHKDITMTLQTYTHINYDDVNDELKRIGFTT